MCVWRAGGGECVCVCVCLAGGGGRVCNLRESQKFLKHLEKGDYS